MTATQMFGAAYGYLVVIPDEASGCLGVEARKPPIKGPSNEPILAHSGRSVKARTRYLNIKSVSCPF